MSARIGKTESSCSWPTIHPRQFCSWTTTHHVSSANSSTQVLELAKLSIPTLGQLPRASPLLSDHPPPHLLLLGAASTLVLQIRALACLNWQNRVFPLLSDHPPPQFCLPTTASSPSWHHLHLSSANQVSPLLSDHPPPPRFCQFEHATARIGKTESSCSWPTTPISVLPIRARKCSNWQNQACPCPSTPLFLPIQACKCLNWQNRASHACSTAHHPCFCQFKPILALTLVHTLSPLFCRFQHLCAQIRETVSLNFS